MKKKIKINKRLLIMLMLLVITVISGTFAWFSYRSRESALVLTIGDINDSKVIIKPYQIKETMTPVNIYTSGVYSQVQAINNNSNDMSVNLYYRINQLDENFIDNGLKYTIVSSSTLNGEYTEVKTGDFTDINNNEIVILNTGISSNATQYYRVYLWLDSSVGNQSSIQNLNLDIELNGTISLFPNKPVLDEGMIPVTISADGVVTTVSENDQSWYNYNNQEWANIVLVKEEGTQSRNYYKNNTGKTVNQNDILAYYVWIPRYRYKIWTTDVSSTGNEQSINIQFESKIEPVSSGTTNGSFRTHPAFIWGSNTVSGIWVGKFETTGTVDNLTILPNSTSLVEQSVSSHFANSLKFAGGVQNGSSITFNGNNTYGLTVNTDSHMMKNSEWGAVAYLSHSKYGVNDQIYINNYNNSGFKTGCGGLTYNSPSSTICEIAYGESSDYPQSTTGNISGIFDMSGGAWDYVMGNYNNMIGNSGFTTLPDSRYYNVYSDTNVGTACSGSICIGDSLSETTGWYSDENAFINADSPWLLRGGRPDFGDRAGIFTVGLWNGWPAWAFSFHSVLIVRENSVTVEKPVLDAGMIPVTIANDGTVKTIDENNISWYDYGNKEWANVVLVKESGTQTRSYYKNNTGKTVAESDILAYYVWIPRYKYAFPKADGNPEEISIVFETADAEISTGTATGTSYYTHPAFIWGGEPVAGIWVGKFETGHSTLSSSTTSNNLGCTNTNCANADGLIIKPNVQSLRYNSVSNFFYASRSMTRSTNPFGLNSSTTDTHMMKNSEWGAVAYLSHSKYGINQEIYINNSSDYYTGRSGGGSTSSSSYGVYTWTGQEIDASGTIGSYASDRTLGTNVSTTGNVTGVYDMSGGSHEHVMGNYGNVKGSSGFTTLPDSKYYDLYSSTQFTGSYSINMGLCTLETCGGHALSETAKWYQDNASFVDSDYPWFIRGGSCVNGASAGAFSLDGDYGGAGSLGFRLVLLPHTSSSLSYTVSYDANGGSSSISSQTKEHGVNLTLTSTIPTRTGYTFKGWATSASATSAEYQAGGSFNVDANTTLYAVWQINTYSIATEYYYVYNDNSAVYIQTENHTVNYGSSYTQNYEITSPTGYHTVGTFEYYNSLGDIKFYNVGSSFTVTEDVVIRMYFYPDTYTISYNANGGSGAPSAQTKTHDVTLTLSTTTPTRTGYTFKGWSTSSSATSATYAAGDNYTANADAILYAVWQINTYTIFVSHYYRYQNSTTTYFTSTNTTATHGSTFTPTGTTPPTGYQNASYFIYYYSNSNGDGVQYIGRLDIGESFTVTQNMLVQVYYLPNTYTVSYDANGGSGAPSAQTKTHDVTLTLSTTTPTRTGYTFKGWSTSSSATSATYAAGDNYTANAAATLYAVWQINTYTVQSDYYYYYQNTTWTLFETKTDTRNYGSSFAPYNVSAPTGYYAGNNYGYYNSAGTFIDGGTVGINSFTVTENMRVHVHYYPNTYTVSYDANGGSGAPSAQTKTHDVTLTLSTTTPTRTGYTFKGWSTNSSATSATYAAGGSYTANAAATLYAVWEKIYEDKNVTGQSGTLTFTPSSTTGYCDVTYQIGWSETYNAYRNTSDVTITSMKAMSTTCEYMAFPGCAGAYSTDRTGTILINGTVVNTFTCAYYRSSILKNQWYDLHYTAGLTLPAGNYQLPWTLSGIAHNSDGTKTVPIKLDFELRDSGGNFVHVFNSSQNITLTDTR